MKKLKKTISLFLTLAMALGMAVTSFAFEDVQSGTKVSEAVGILANLGIIEGFEDGSFRPDESVTRAQMAAIICRTLGYEEQAKGSAGATAFEDVAANHWASGYINVAQSLGIINGYGNGCYGPEDSVTYEQAVKMLVVALGYELDAQSKGGWSAGYMAVASREGITKNSGGTVGAPAVRGTIAVIVYNSLEVRLMDQKSWSTSGDDQYGKTDETILSQYLNVQKWEGVVTSVPYYDYAQQGYEKDADEHMTLSGAFYTEYNGGKLDKNYETLEAVDCSLVADANTLVGKKVVAYIGAEEDDETGNRMVYAIAEKQGANKVTTISATQLVKSGDKYWNENKVIGYRSVGSTRINSVDLDDNVEVIVNFGAGNCGTVNTTAALSGAIENGGTVSFISNDSDSKADYIIVTTYDEEAIVEAIDVEDGLIMFRTYNGELEDIDMEDEDCLTVVIKDGEVATPDDIEENDTISIVGNNDFHDDSFRVLYVSSETVAGYIESYGDDVVTINGKDYELSVLSGFEPEELSGKEGIFFINVDGQIAWEEAAQVSRGNYGLVLAAGETSGLRGGYEVEVLLADGSVAQYVLNSKAYIDGVQEEKSDALTYAALISKMEDDGKAYRVKSEKAVQLVYEVTVKNGKISKLVPVKAGPTVRGREYDEENMSYGSISFNESTVIISIETATGAFVESDDISIGYTTDYFVDGEGESCKLYSFDENSNDIAGLVVAYGLTTSIPQNGDALVITSKKTREIDGDTAYVVTGLQGGQIKTYTIYSDDETYTGDVDNLAKGNVILLGAANSAGVVSDFRELYIESTGRVEATDNTTDEIYYVAGNINENREPTNSKFHLVDITHGGQNHYSQEDGVSMRVSANYTLVDYSESSTNPEVTKKSKGKSLFSRLDKYEYRVFIRYYEDELVEVVVYRYNNGGVGLPEEDEAPNPVIAAPAADVAEGEVVSGTEVALSAQTGATIYYTLDGTTPTTSSVVYSGKIAITSNVTIKAIAVVGGIESAVETFVYYPAAPQVEQEQENVNNEVPAETQETPNTGSSLAGAPAAPKAEEPKTEEPAAPKAEEPKPEEPAAPKAEEPKTEEPAAPKAEEPKPEEPAAPKAEEPKTEEPAAPKAEEPKTEEPAAPKAEEPKTEEPATPKAEEPKTEEPAAPKAEEPKTEIKQKIKIPAKANVKELLEAQGKKIVKFEGAKINASAIAKIEGARIEKAPVAVIEKAAVVIKTDINKATYAQIIAIDGITDALATKIIEYRAKNGEFKAVEDLKKVEGITDAIYDKIKENITV